MKSHTFTRNGTVYYIPERMMPGIDRYVNHRVKPGDFLQAIMQRSEIGLPVRRR